MPLFTILTLFPESLEPYLRCGILGSALDRGLARVQLIDFRDWSRDRHRTVDDRPFGGGPGMVLKPEPILECIEWIEAREGPQRPMRKIALCPSGPTFDQERARQLASEAEAQDTLLLCGRYEGFDERLFELCDLERLSIGDFVLAGGELAALAVLEAVVRLLPGALGNDHSAVEDSFSHGPRDLDHPHYTRPRNFRGLEVPQVLLDGDHAAIRAWRAGVAEERSRERARTRPESCEGDLPPINDALPDSDRTRRANHLKTPPLTDPTGQPQAADRPAPQGDPASDGRRPLPGGGTREGS